MGVYVEMLPDERILKSLAGFRSVVILGCTGCANISLGFNTDFPVFQVMEGNEGEPGKLAAVAIRKEADRLKKFLEGNGIDAVVEAQPHMCALSDEALRDGEALIARCRAAEAVIVLACAGGAVGTRMLLGEGVKILPGMKTVGNYFRYYNYDASGKYVYIDKDRSVCIRLFGK